MSQRDSLREQATPTVLIVGAGCVALISGAGDVTAVSDYLAAINWAAALPVT